MSGEEVVHSRSRALGTKSWLHAVGMFRMAVTSSSSRVRAYLFPGQGAQKLGMGGELFSRFPQEVARIDAVLGYSIQELCLHDPNGQLNNTRYTQPALYVVSCLSFLDGLRRDPFEGSRVAAGHSVGEYAALFTAGCCSLENGLRLVQKRGELMSRIQGGGMVAVIGIEEAVIRQRLHQYAYDTVDIANLNAPEQTVLSGPADEVADLRPLFEEAGARMIVPLKVSGAFHSRYMTEAAQEFGAYLQQFEFDEPRFPVISNVFARPYSTSEITETLARQLTSPVRWTDTLRFIRELGDVEYREMGDSQVLTQLLRRQ